MKRIKVDIPFLISTCILVVAGYLIFISASFGLLSDQTGKYANVTWHQTLFGLILGTLACIIVSQINYKVYRKYSLFLFLASIIVTLLVFVPVLGMSHGGASRWINFGSLSFQPSEFLKIGFVIFLSAWMARVKEKAQTFKYGLLPFFIMLAVTGVILLKQPDTDTFIITAVAGFAIFLAGGGKWKHLFLSALIGVVVLGGLIYTTPYIRSRINTFINPSENSLGSGYQIQQSLIAVGSGGIFGRGFGQSIQKFDVLPEPIGDSIFAVASEEFGFFGAASIVLLFVFFGFYMHS